MNNNHHPEEIMKALTAASLALAAIISLPGFAAAQGVYIDVGPGAGPRPYYRDYYGGYGGPGDYRYRDGGERRYSRPGRYQSWNGCQPGFTVQDGRCKPYRGY
jgi:hypothetical protein